MPHTLWTGRALRAADGWQRMQSSDDVSAPTTTLLGPEIAAPIGCTEIIPSWNATTPEASWIELDLRVQQAGRWSSFYQIALWDAAFANSRRRSFDAQCDENGFVATDTLILNAPISAVQPRVLLRGTPPAELHALYLCLSAPDAPLPFVTPDACTELPVPPRSQMIYPDGGAVWCSPTCIAMLLAYWYARTGVPRLAPFEHIDAVPQLAVPGVYDPTYDGHGNWIFNTAFAASYGLEAYVTRFGSLRELAPWLRAGVPVVISVAWQEGALQNACIPSSNGHLLIVAGFDAAGNVIAADPAAAQAADVRRLYRADELERAWQNNSSGTAYIVHPTSYE